MAKAGASRAPIPARRPSGSADIPGVRLGLTICYDIRFPYLYRALAEARSRRCLAAPACFTRQTGEAHWVVLHRARAIENGAFMMSAAQAGRHEDGRETFGHSIIVDPWGRVLAEGGGDQPECDRRRDRPGPCRRCTRPHPDLAAHARIQRRRSRCGDCRSARHDGLSIHR